MKYATAEACSLSMEEVQEVIELLESLPAWLAARLEGLNDAQLRRKPAPEPEAFSCIENVLHLRDIEVEGYSRRLRRMLAERNPVLPDIDGTRLAIEGDYNSRELAPALADFAAARQANVLLLRTLREDDLARTAELETVGHITLAQLLQLWRNHDLGHRRELEELLAVIKES